MKVIIKKSPAQLHGNIELPPSKSIYNRLLIIRELSGIPFDINPAPQAYDNILLDMLLKDRNGRWDVRDAGTPMRFLSALAALRPGPIELTGTERMKQRPIGPLCNALEQLGAKIKYHIKPGFPPFSIEGGSLNGGEVHIDPSLSSQFVSSLMLVGPYIKGGLHMKLSARPVSAPYIRLTGSIMQQFGVHPEIYNDQVIVPEGQYHTVSTTVPVEADWSAASYWFGLAALHQEASLFFPGLHFPSLQGDSILLDFSRFTGVVSHDGIGGMSITKAREAIDTRVMDFADNPDLAPAIIVTMAAFRRQVMFHGLETLAIKESDRTSVLAENLGKLNVVFRQETDGWMLDARDFNTLQHLEVNTYNDHRIAMAFAMLAPLMEVRINDAECVKKSYPLFFHQLAKTGFIIQEA